MESSKLNDETQDAINSEPVKAVASRDIQGDGPGEPEKGSIAVDDSKSLSEHEVPTAKFQPEADLEKLPNHGRSGKDPDSVRFSGEEEDPKVGVPFQRSSTAPKTPKAKSFTFKNVGEGGMRISRMHKFSLYGTSTWYYLIGADIMEEHYRVLKIDRTAPPEHLNIFEDDIVYNRREMHQLLRTIDDGNKGTGGLKEKCSAWGLLGFIRFTDAYYMLLITKRAQVAMLGGHYIYQIDGTEMIPLTTGSTSRFQKDRNPDETRYLTILNSLDLTRSFYFSYSYNVTRSLQQNIVHERIALKEGITKPARNFQDMFVWNEHLLGPARGTLKNVFDWCLPVIHGYIDQSSLDVFGRRIYLTIIARRSRFFAGARFLKRGTNDLGYVANDVETEQVVSDALTTSFHAPGPRLYANPTYTSYVQHRGSIPLYWTQDNTGVTPKPAIDLSLVDPFYSAAALHFDNLFERYGAPIHVLNLIKARERTPRESKLLYEYKNCIDYLNQSLPDDKKILYDAFDMSRAAKTRGQDVIGVLEQLAEKVLQRTGFFQNGDEELGKPQVQNGVARMNCIDCLDRTNAAQFVIGKRALGRQLHALGVIARNTVEYDSDCVDIFTHMFHGHGDAIAIQYGGSHLVNTMATYRKMNHWQNSSRDMVESFKRYYHNSFLDSQRQEAYNLFLGNYIYAQGQPMLWELSSDYHLHHQDPRLLHGQERRSYIDWYTPSHLQQRTLPPSITPDRSSREAGDALIRACDDYWLEYYRPLALSSYLKIFAFRLASPRTGKDAKDGAFPTRKEDMSPFVPRIKHDHHHGKDDKKGPRKGVTIIDPSSETESLQESIAERRLRNMHLTVPPPNSPAKQSILRDPHFETELQSSLLSGTGAYLTMKNSLSASTGLSSTLRPGAAPTDKTLINQWTLAQLYEHSMNPSVTATEEEEYARYVEHPLSLPLVVNTEVPSIEDPIAMEYYEYLCMTEGGIQAPKDPDDEYIRITTTDLPKLDTDVASIRSFASHNRPMTSQSVNTPFSHAPSYSYLQQSNLHSHLYSSFPADPQQQTYTPVGKFQTAEEDMEEFENFLKVSENPLDVAENDRERKRYKAYRKWLRGKSFFKQSKVDPEWQNQLPVR